jgi:CRISPR-associated protein Cmr5
MARGKVMADQQSTSPGPTLDQRRAAHAWNKIREIKQTCDEAKQEEYAGEAKKLPIRIMAAGLGQALAFIASKADKKKGLEGLLDHLFKWVVKERPLPATAGNSLLECVIKGDSDFMRRATDETLAYLQWLNRFAEAEGLKRADSSDD